MATWRFAILDLLEWKFDLKFDQISILLKRDRNRKKMLLPSVFQVEESDLLNKQKINV